MYLKVMSDESMADRNFQKSFRLIECREVSFFRKESGNPFAHVDGEEVALWGNAYVLNAAGKTIDSFSCNALTAPTDEGVTA